MDEDGKRPGARKAFERARARLGRVGASGLERLRRSGSRMVGALETAAERLKETPAAEKLGEAIEVRRVIKRAEDAQARGNAPMAFRLLEGELRAHPDEPRLAIALWRVALAAGRAEDAAEVLLPAIRKRAGEGNLEEAAGLWGELVTLVPAVRADAGLLVRLVPALRERDLELAVKALSHALDPQATGLTPGVAARAIEYARDLDPALALRATRAALASPDLHETRRERLRELMGELERAVAERARMEQQEEATREEQEPPPFGAAPGVGADVGEPEDDLVEIVEPLVDTLAPAARFAGIKLQEAVPVALGEDGLELVVAGGRRARLAYDKVEAIAVAEVLDADPGGAALVDLLLNWSSDEGGPLRIVRLRDDQFEPGSLADPSSEGVSDLRAFVAQLLERTGASPLADAACAAGDPLRIFESESEYQREVLRVEA